MKTKRQLIALFDAGHVEDLLKECQRYGTILQSREWEGPEGRYAGAWRERAINHHGMGWIFTQHNGQTEGVEMYPVPLIVGIHGQAVTEEENARHIRIRDMK